MQYKLLHLISQAPGSYNLCENASNLDTYMQLHVHCKGACGFSKWCNPSLSTVCLAIILILCFCVGHFQLPSASLTNSFINLHYPNFYVKQNTVALLLYSILYKLLIGSNELPFMIKTPDGVGQKGVCRPLRYAPTQCISQFGSKKCKSKYMYSVSADSFHSDQDTKCQKLILMLKPKIEQHLV